jgi:hypothetical protein
LLRFQLYCELVYHPGDSFETVSEWEERTEEQDVFWLRCEWWEVEEVKCVYQVLVFCLENASPRSSRSEKVSGEQSQQRGLTQLRNFLDDSTACPTALGKDICGDSSTDNFIGSNARTQTTTAISHNFALSINYILLLQE